MEDIRVTDLAKDGSNREVARIRPDGTWWIAPDITMPEIHTAFHPLLETAAKLLKKVSDVRKAVQD